MDQASKDVIKWWVKWICLTIVPIGILSWHFNQPFINGIIETKSYFLVFLFFAGVFDGIKDTSLFHYSTSYLRNFPAIFFDGTISWKNKYKDGDPSKGRTYVPVIFTDCFHSTKSLHTLFLLLSLYTTYVPTPLLLLYLVYKWGFHVSYR